MNKKKIITNNNLWWLDFSILNLNNIKFKYFYFSNIFYIKLINFFFFFLINKNNINNMLFYNLDSLIFNNNINDKYNCGVQTMFFDLQVLLEINFNNKLTSLSGIYSGNTWLEREMKEMGNITFLNLLDNRKLLSNYNYNNNLEYTHFNSIINDIKI